MSKFTQFIKNYWQYYRELEDELLATRKCVDFYKENYKSFSVEYLKLFQAICGEIDVLGKTMAGEVNSDFKADDTKNNILKWWYEVKGHYQFFWEMRTKERPEPLIDVEITFINDENIKPWAGFETEKYTDSRGAIRIRHKEGCKTPKWWRDYTIVKHSRTLPIKDDPDKTNYFKANLGNTLSAFAALYILEKAYMAEVGSVNEREAFADYSRLFDRVGNITTEDIDRITNGTDL